MNSRGEHLCEEQPWQVDEQCTHNGWTLSSYSTYLTIMPY